MYALSPKGTRILGTLEELTARAEIASFTRGPDGKIEWDYEGDTEVFWDGQMTVKDKQGREIFLDANGDEWALDQLTLVEEEG